MASFAKLLACLKEMGIEASIQTFSDRKRIQKLAYLAQEVFNVPLNFRFSWYLHGPYSPDLTRALYENSDFVAPISMELEEWEKERIRKLRNFLGEDIHSADRLELLVSLHFLRILGRQYRANMGEVVQLLNEKKPFFSDYEIKKYWAKLDSIEPYEES